VTCSPNPIYGGYLGDAAITFYSDGTQQPWIIHTSSDNPAIGTTGDIYVYGPAGTFTATFSPFYNQSKAGVSTVPIIRRYAEQSY
jgi:hypothetical protein